MGLAHKEGYHKYFQVHILLQLQSVMWPLDVVPVELQPLEGPDQKLWGVHGRWWNALIVIVM